MWKNGTSRESWGGNVKIVLRETEKKKYVWWRAEDWVSKEEEWKGRLQETMKKMCEECDTCKKYQRNPSRLVVGLPLAEHFNKVLTVDMGELNGEKFLVMVDWVSRNCQAE